LSNGSIISDAISALINLGYHPLDAQKRVNKVHESLSGTATLSQLITHALRAD
jgi:Holliday junction resolvasome RuvABC DNA-binding subunit